MINTFICIISTIGALAILFASIGILRMPDFYLRLSVTVKAATLGVGLFLTCTMILFPDVSVTTKSLAIILFLVLTAPVAAHMIARTAYRTGVKMWKGTRQLEDAGYEEEKTTENDNLSDKRRL